MCGSLAAVGVLAGCGHAAPRPTTTSPTVTAPQPPKQDESLPWPTYGADNARTRSVTAPGLRPPFRRVWSTYGRTLLEFPPVVGYGLLYEEGFDGVLHASDPATGAAKWHYDSRYCGWSSPALGHDLVFATFIGDSRCSPQHPSGGRIVALSARAGRVVWRHSNAGSESSPLVARGIVYFGDRSGRISALDAATGATRWRYETGAPVKAAPALDGGRLFVANYAGDLYAFDPRTGKVLWRSGGHGKFYSGPSVADGRVYIGSVAGSVDAFSARDGRQLWSFGTGGYVYSSPAVWRGIVLIGSYDHHFYAINGATGSLRWDFHADDEITGAASVVDGIVYFSTQHSHTTYALDAASGRLIRTWPDGEYSPAVAAGGRLYLVGLGRIYALAPRRQVQR